MKLRQACAILLAVTGGLSSCAQTGTAPALLISARLPEPEVKPGDRLRITVWEGAEFSGEFRVDADSTLAHAVFDTVKVGGVGLVTAKARLVGLLNAYKQNPRLSVELLQAVVVDGAVGQPGLHLLPVGTTVGQAIAEAGGSTPDGRLDQVRVIRGGTDATIDLNHEYARYASIPVQSGDRISVAHASGFSFLRDIFGPLVTLTSLGISIANLIVTLNQ